MSEKKSFVLNDETRVNSHGFILSNAGGNLDRFRSNPVMLNAHDHQQVIGAWENIRTEGNQILADPNFDTEDDQAKKIQGKVERGFLKGASLGINIQEAVLQNIPTMGMVPVVTKWEALEASLVAVPSNSGSMRVYDEKGCLLSADDVKLSIENLLNPNLNPKSEQNMDKIKLTAEAATALNLSAETDVTALCAAVIALSAAKTKAENDMKAHLSAQATTLVEGAIAAGKITADKKESFVAMAMNDFKQAKDVLDVIPAKQTLSDKVKKPGANTENRDDWSYMKWAKEDPTGLSAMQTSDPEKFAQLKASYKSKH